MVCLLAVGDCRTRPLALCRRCALSALLGVWRKTRVGGCSLPRCTFGNRTFPALNRTLHHERAYPRISDYTARWIIFECFPLRLQYVRQRHPTGPIRTVASVSAHLRKHI